MPSPHMESSRHLVAILNEVLKQLRPHQILAAADQVRRLPGDEDATDLYASIADAIEQEAGARAGAALRPPVEEAIPDAVGVLAEEVAAAVVAMPEIVRGVMFNMHGEPLVYGTDDLIYHGDADWKGYAVRNGEAQGLVLDSFEQAFVSALWHSGEHVRRAKSG